MVHGSLFIVHGSWIFGYKPLPITHQPPTNSAEPLTINIAHAE
ncbi:MAG: hypothetical protein ACHBN1_13340 [Heteroscytonema crispum UTEX LB 1556]